MSELTADMKRSIIRDFLNWCSEHNRYGKKADKCDGVYLESLEPSPDGWRFVDEGGLLDAYLSQWERDGEV